MQRADILTELYKVAKHENVLTTRIYDLESSLETALILAGRFEFDDAVKILSDILKVLRAFPPSTNSLRLEALSLTVLGNIRRDQGIIDTPNGAYLLYNRARDIWRHLGEPARVAFTTWYLGACNEMNKNYKEALKYYKEALDIVEVIGGLQTLHSHILLRIGTVLTKNGTFGEAEKAILQSIKFLEKEGSSSNFAYTHQKLAIVHFSEGRIDIAMREAEDAMRVVPNSDKFRLTQTKILVADLLLSTGNYNTGLKTASEAELLANEYGFNHQLSALHSVINRHISEQS